MVLSFCLRICIVVIPRLSGFFLGGHFYFKKLYILVGHLFGNSHVFGMVNWFCPNHGLCKKNGFLQVCYLHAKRFVVFNMQDFCERVEIFNAVIRSFNNNKNYAFIRFQLFSFFLLHFSALFNFLCTVRNCIYFWYHCVCIQNQILLFFRLHIVFFLTLGNISQNLLPLIHMFCQHFSLVSAELLFSVFIITIPW